jgi:membrane-associated phospholipid phosphatase
MNIDQIELDRAARYKAEIPMAYRWLSKGLSFVFHPVFMLTYAYILLAAINPFLFGEATFERVFSFDGRGAWFLTLFFFSAVIPVLGILIMKGLGMINSLSMHTQDERKIPYVLTGMFYMSLVATNAKITGLPLEIKSFALGATIALFIAFFINLFSKISMHTVGAGGFLGMIMILLLRGYAGTEYLFIFALLICGIIGTCRLLLGAHNPSDLYGGYMVGLFPQFIAVGYIFSGVSQSV